MKELKNYNLTENENKENIEPTFIEVREHSKTNSNIKNLFILITVLTITIIIATLFIATDFIFTTTVINTFNSMLLMIFLITGIAFFINN